MGLFSLTFALLYPGFLFPVCIFEPEVFLLVFLFSFFKDETHLLQKENGQ